MSYFPAVVNYSLDCVHSYCPCIVWNSCSLHSCARFQCFLPESFVQLVVSAGSSSHPLHTIIFFPFFPNHILEYFLFYLLFSQFFEFLVLSLLSLMSCLDLTLTTGFHPTFLPPFLTFICVSPFRRALAPQGQPSSQASKSWMTSARKQLSCRGEPLHSVSEGNSFVSLPLIKKNQRRFPHVMRIIFTFSSFI